MEEKILFPLWLEEETLNRFQTLARAEGLSTPVLMQRLLKQIAEKEVITDVQVNLTKKQF